MKNLNEEQKLKESEKGISFLLETRQITQKTKQLSLEASQKERDALAEFYDLPLLSSLVADLKITRIGEVIEVKGVLRASFQQICVVSNEPFDQNMNADFTVLFTDRPRALTQSKAYDVDMEEEYVEPVQHGRINLKEVISEQFGLNLNPFPKKTEGYFEYYEEKSSDEKKNPFSVLKELTK